MLRCIIFDFNGVIIDDEDLHFRAFARVLEEEGIELLENEYFTRYLGLDDKVCFAAVLADKQPGSGDDERVMELVERKAGVYLQELEGGMRVFPGAADLVKRLSRELVLAIASGARRHEIEHVIEQAGIAECFSVVVSADEVLKGKPEPEGYLKALSRVRAVRPGLDDLEASECLVIEDAPKGIRAAHRAGMTCVAVTNSCEPSELREADRVVGSLKDVGLDDLRRVASARNDRP